MICILYVTLYLVNLYDNLYQKIENIEGLKEVVGKNELVLIYYFSSICNVCKVFKPQIAQMSLEYFPQMPFFEVDVEKYPEISSQQSIFTIPTIIVYSRGKEWIRKSRYIGIEELKSVIDKLYRQIF